MKSENISAESESVEEWCVQTPNVPLLKGMELLVDGLPKNAKDITGERFGKLTAIKPHAYDSHKQMAWICRCDCGQVKSIRLSHLTSGHTNSCGCFKPDLRLTQEESVSRFWDKVNKTENCWLWTGNTQLKHKRWKKGGYGVIVRTPTSGGKRRVFYAHRFSWELHFGPIPTGMFVCHHCDVVLCVRPDHIFLGTAADNNADMHKKGRRLKMPIPGDKNFHEWFQSSIDRTQDCWIWKGKATSAGGYGLCRWTGPHGQIAPHRMMWILNNGEIPSGLEVRHRCDNKKCVNLDHLFLGSSGGKPFTDEQRVDAFWKKVIKSDGCWEWSGARSGGSGCGVMRDQGRNTTAHKFSWEIHNEKVPDGFLVRQTCNNRACVNPKHLLLHARHHV